MRSDGSALLNAGLRCQRYKTQITPTKERELSRNTDAAPVVARAKSATIRPPRAGPRARARLNPAELSETASGNCARGITSGTIACHAGLFIAAPMFSRKVRISRIHGEITSKNVSTLR